MPNTSLKLCLALGAATLLSARPSHAQSDTLREALRLQRPEAVELAMTELEACREAKCGRLTQLSLLAGFLQLSVGDPDAALRHLDAAAVPASLEPWRRFYQGQALFYSRRYLDAARAFESASTLAGASLRDRAQLRLAEALLEGGIPARAAPLFEKRVSKGSGPELLFERARAFEALGKRSKATADFKLLAQRHPTHPLAAQALERLGRTRFTLAEHLARARGFIDAGAPAEALKELGQAHLPLLAGKKAAAARLALVRAAALYAAGDAEHASEQVDFAATKGPPAVAAEALMLRARALLRSTNSAEARARLLEVEARYPREGPADDAAFLAAWLELQQGAFETAAQSFEAFTLQHRRSNKRDEALWYQALSLLRAERHADAATKLRQLVAEHGRSSLVPQALYWQARIGELGKLGTAEDWAALFERVVTRYPGSFYAVLAADRLQKLGGEAVRAFTQRPRPLEEPLPPELQTALELSEAGLLRDAAEELRAQLASPRSVESALRSGHALLALGEYGHAYALAVRNLWGAGYGQRRPEALALLYPRAYPSAVEQAAESQSIDPYWLWSTMRRESAFRAEVASAADARGLMQLIPPTAAAVAKALKLPNPAPDALFSPALNLRLAAWYVRALFDRFGHPAAVAAAYNAGPNAVLRWLEQNRSLPLDLWVESISYRETRGYVKQVVADYFIYHQLYGAPEKRPVLAWELPAAREAGVSF